VVFRTGLLAAVPSALCLLMPSPGTASRPASFGSSDPVLTGIWAASVATARNMVSSGPLTVDPDGYPCAIDVPTVILDGSERDRCPYIGDLAVTGMTLIVSTPTAQNAIRDELLWFANAQHADGAIPASPLARGDPAVSSSFVDGNLMLFDYSSYWVQCLYDYVLYTGDVGLASRVWPNLVELMETWYPAHTQSDGLLVNDLGWGDYAFIPRRGELIAYYNAGYALALRDAASIASWTDNSAEAESWKARAAALAAPFNTTFFDPPTGAYLDAPTGPPIHPEDGNAFAILAGLASSTQSKSALAYLSSTGSRPWGNSMADDNAWDTPTWGSDMSERAYPFVGYFDVVARFRASLDDSALGLIRREWGWMLSHGSRSTMWENIGPGGGPPPNNDPSWDHGWSSGAAPALTTYVLGVRPTSPGFATFVVDPHPGASVTSATGTLPTPHGDLQVSWRKVHAGLSISVTAPAGEIWANGPRVQAAMPLRVLVRTGTPPRQSSSKR